MHAACSAFRASSPTSISTSRRVTSRRSPPISRCCTLGRSRSRSNSTSSGRSSSRLRFTAAAACCGRSSGPRPRCRLPPLHGSWRAIPPGSFYLVPFRAWELGLGALLAVGALPKPGRSAAELLSALGLGMIVGAMLLFDQTTPFPGFAAALPCVGAMLFLHATQGTPTVTARIMSLRAAVFVGLISYSLYLWHWPVLVLGRAALARPARGCNRERRSHARALSRGALVAFRRATVFARAASCRARPCCGVERRSWLCRRSRASA